MVRVLEEIKKKHKDDELIFNKIKRPEICVDYLSYKFNEMDLAVSWREVTRQKQNITDSIRLENASWRTWTKQRNNLKTIHPQTLNWLKEGDVTWLYGPLHTVKIEESTLVKNQYLNNINPPIKSALRKSKNSNFKPTLRFKDEVERYIVIEQETHSLLNTFSTIKKLTSVKLKDSIDKENHIILNSFLNSNPIFSDQDLNQPSILTEISSWFFYYFWSK